jgi:hypothetical protein
MDRISGTSTHGNQRTNNRQQNFLFLLSKSSDPEGNIKYQSIALHFN